MINFVSTDREKIIVIGIGLNPEDIKRLQEEQSLRLHVSDMGINTGDVKFELLIFGGKSNKKMVDELRAEMGPELNFIKQGIDIIKPSNN
jgi:hypothetical protein